jgi:CheY-like chemotaxis protein
MTLGSILLVSLEPLLRNSYARLLIASQFLTTSAASLPEALQSFHSGDFDLVLLCPSIPAMQGEWLVRLIRAAGSLTPVFTLDNPATLPSEIPAQAINNLIAANSSLSLVKSLALQHRGPLYSSCKVAQYASAVHLLCSPGRCPCWLTDSVSDKIPVASAAAQPAEFLPEARSA